MKSVNPRKAQDNQMMTNERDQGDEGTRSKITKSEAPWSEDVVSLARQLPPAWAPMRGRLASQPPAGAGTGYGRVKARCPSPGAGEREGGLQPRWGTESQTSFTSQLLVSGRHGHTSSQCQGQGREWGRQTDKISVFLLSFDLIKWREVLNQRSRENSRTSYNQQSDFILLIKVK